MPRIKIDLPETFPFSCQIPIRITDINYGGHTGNDTILSIIHEARMQYLKSLGYTEMNIEGIGMIMADVSIEFRKELFYGDIILAYVVVGEISRIGFELFYKLETYQEIIPLKPAPAVVARTFMICYDYGKKKIVSVPEPAVSKLKGL